mmetsp:Transcript_14086/g.41942  ORF Transcript_14086/g.41942 Transcript_14086/m.41942 type:complete len:348 (+) Transcript_14086:286-1329(+)
MPISRAFSKMTPHTVQSKSGLFTRTAAFCLHLPSFMPMSSSGSSGRSLLATLPPAPVRQRLPRLLSPTLGTVLRPPASEKAMLPAWRRAPCGSITPDWSPWESQATPPLFCPEKQLLSESLEPFLCSPYQFLELFLCSPCPFGLRSAEACRPGAWQRLNSITASSRLSSRMDFFRETVCVTPWWWRLRAWMFGLKTAGLVYVRSTEEPAVNWLKSVLIFVIGCMRPSCAVGGLGGAQFRPSVNLTCRGFSLSSSERRRNSSRTLPFTAEQISATFSEMTCSIISLISFMSFFCMIPSPPRQLPGSVRPISLLMFSGFDTGPFAMAPAVVTRLLSGPAYSPRKYPASP